MRESDEGETGSLDVVFEVLADERRRRALQCLNEHGETLALADLAEEVAIQETDLPITDVPAEDVKQVYMSLYHNHIPKLEDASIVRYDQDTDGVALSADNDFLERVTTSL